MPNCFCALAFNGQDAKQTQPAFKLKNQIVAWHKLMWHHSSNWILRNDDRNRKGREELVPIQFGTAKFCYSFYIGQIRNPRRVGVLYLCDAASFSFPYHEL